MAETFLKEKDGLWILFNGKEYCVGLTKATQEELGDVTFASLPKIGKQLAAGEPLTELEAEKAVSEFKSPLTGIISSINEKAAADPSVLNAYDEMDSWLVSFKEVDPKEFAAL